MHCRANSSHHTDYMECFSKRQSTNYAVSHFRMHVRIHSPCTVYKIRATIVRAACELQRGTITLFPIPPSQFCRWLQICTRHQMIYFCIIGISKHWAIEQFWELWATIQPMLLAKIFIQWRRDHAHKLPYWSQACNFITLIQPSSAAAERVFSLLANSFNSNQESALEDYIQTSLM